MALLRITSPHTQRPGRKTAWVMSMVIIATLPGLIAQTYWFGWGTPINIVIAIITALMSEAAILKLRHRHIGFFLQDYSAVLTAVLLGLALPPTVPWWLTVTAVAFAIIFAKQIYGGLGHNPFNPAMVGYAIVLVSFPVPMTQWLGTADLVTAQTTLSFSQSLQAIFGQLPSVDAYTMATPLDAFKHKEGLMAEEAFSQIAGLHASNISAWFWVNLAYLAGGFALIYLRIITWHTPVALLGALGLMALLFFILDVSNAATPLFHLTTGAAMLGAFFILDDPIFNGLAISLIFGILVSTILTLIVIPTLYYAAYRKQFEQHV